MSSCHCKCLQVHSYKHTIPSAFIASCCSKLHKTGGSFHKFYTISIYISCVIPINNSVLSSDTNELDAVNIPRT